MKRVESARTIPAPTVETQTRAPRNRSRRAAATGAATIVTAPVERSRSRFDFARSDRVLKIVGVEAVAAALCRLRLRVHEEAELSTLGRARQRHVVSGVEGDPVAFPSAEELGSHRLDQRMLDLQPLARFLAGYLRHVRWIHGHPPV